MTDLHRANQLNRTPSNPRRRQAGMSMIGLLMIAGIAMFFVLAAFKVGPSYFEYWTVSKIAENVASESELLRGPKSGVYKKVQAGFRQNNLWDAKAEDRIRLVKDKAKGSVIHVDYESRTNLFGNVYVVTKFEKEVTGQ